MLVGVQPANVNVLVCVTDPKQVASEMMVRV